MTDTSEAPSIEDYITPRPLDNRAMAKGMNDQADVFKYQQDLRSEQLGRQHRSVLLTFYNQTAPTPIDETEIAQAGATYVQAKANEVIDQVNALSAALNALQDQYIEVITSAQTNIKSRAELNLLPGANTQGST